MPKFHLNSEIARGVSDFLPAPLELYYKHFDDYSYYTHHAGITDRYGAGYDEDEDEDNEDMPGAGHEHLEKEVKTLLDYLVGLDTHNVLIGSKRKIYKSSNYEANLFVGFIMFLEHNTMVQLQISPARRKTRTAITIFTDDYDRPGIADLVEYAKQFIAPLPTKKDKIHIITQSNNDFYLKDIPLKDGKNKTKFSYDHYNEGFEELSERIINTLQNQNESGLVLLHGDAGTGKTTWLKRLLHTITNKKLIYMPPDLTQHISSPGFITFMMGEAMNSILLIEDAENVLLHRESGGNQAVSNILNISDGILGDVLKLQIVCTFNSSLDTIDPALRRPGRCIAEYRFEKLKADRAGNLLADLYGDDVVWEPKDMTLAEIFNYTKPQDATPVKQKFIGFMPNHVPVAKKELE